jgi:hypothetical protein
MGWGGAAEPCDSLTCRHDGSAPGPGLEPQAAGATLAAEYSGGRTGVALSDNGAAGAGHQGAGPAAGR